MGAMLRNGDASPGLGLWEDAYIRNLVPTRDRIFTQPSKYFSILKILQYDYALLSLRTLLLYESLRSKNLETIVIVSTGCPNIGLL